MGSGSIDWQTPYARITGSGDGSFDVYSFIVTNQMLNTPAITSGGALTGSNTDGSTFYKDVVFRLTGRVTPGDVWKLGIRYHDYTVQGAEITSTTTLRQVAELLVGKLDARYHPNATSCASATASCVFVSAMDPNAVFIRVHDDFGFNLTGLTVNEVQQDATGAANITRTQTVRTTSGADIQLTAAAVTFNGTPAAGERWAIALFSGGVYNAFFHDVVAGESSDTVFEDIKNQIAANTGFTAGRVGSKITIGVEGTTTQFVMDVNIGGRTQPSGTATIDATPKLLSDGEAVVWTKVNVTLPSTVLLGETWKVELTNEGAGAVTLTRQQQVTAPGDDTPEEIVADLDGNTPAYTITSSGRVLTIERSGGFTVNVTTLPSGSFSTVDQGGQPNAVSVTLGTLFQANDVLAALA